MVRSMELKQSLDDFFLDCVRKTVRDIEARGVSVSSLRTSITLVIEEVLSRKRSMRRKLDKKKGKELRVRKAFEKGKKK